MIKITDECVHCPPGTGCLGEYCPNKHVEHYICDKCGEEVDDLYWVNGEQFCSDCVLSEFDKVET